MNQVKREIVYKLQTLINSQEGLWKEIGKLTRTMDYILASEDFSKRVLMEIEVIEQHLGKVKETEEIRDLISSLSQSPIQQSPIHSVA